MRKLKLQMQLSVDGFIAGPAGEMDWMIWDWDQELKDWVTALTQPVDTILLGRKLAEGFIPTWADRYKNPDGSEDGAQKMVETPKVVFSKTLSQSPWKNARVATGNLKDEINNTKSQPGGDIIVYGGGELVSALIQERLIDEFNLFINPVILGQGKTIFAETQANQQLILTQTQAFECGVVALQYLLK